MDNDSLLANIMENVFDAKWYTSFYQDVYLSGIDAEKHFMTYGFFEKRLPCEIHAWQLEKDLWQQDEQAYTRLTELLNKNDLQGAVAGFVLAKWWASYNKSKQVRFFISKFFDNPISSYFIPQNAPWLLAFQAEFELDRERAFSISRNNKWKDCIEKKLAYSMLEPVPQREVILNSIWGEQGLGHASVWSSRLNATKKENNQQSVSGKPLVSVIVPMFNASKYIEIALASLINQTWQNIEIICVDDGSTDETIAIVSRLALRNPQIRLLQQSNQGAYVARNLGLAHSKGEFITTHDSDDWSHPEKIALQVEKLLTNPNAKASVSYWVRCTENLEYQRWRIDDGWIYKNISSLLFKREVYQKLGYWDRVAIGADSEYYDRVMAVFGNDAILDVLPFVPLSLGRIASNSLTQSNQTHLRTLYAGVRNSYYSSALRWHRTTASHYLTQVPLLRRFAVPENICRGTIEQKEHNKILIIASSELFDFQWYCQKYELKFTNKILAIKHYLSTGEAAGYYPSEEFIEVSNMNGMNITLLEHIRKVTDEKSYWKPNNCQEYILHTMM